MKETSSFVLHLVFILEAILSFFKNYQRRDRYLWQTDTKLLIFVHEFGPEVGASPMWGVDTLRTEDRPP